MIEPIVNPVKEKIHSDAGVSPVQARTRIRWTSMIIGAILAMGCAFFPELHVIVPGIATIPNILGEQVNKLLDI